MLDLYKRKNLQVSTTIFSNKMGTGEYGKENNVKVGKDSIVRLYDKGRRNSGTNGVDIGYFIINKKVIDPNLNPEISFDKDILF